VVLNAKRGTEAPRKCLVGSPADPRRPVVTSALPPIVLQKSKVAAVQIFGENLKRKEVNDSYSLSRATEVAHEFGARR
jgi:hypothetical protein